MPNVKDQNDLPRERLLRLGAPALSDTELLSILLGSGCAGLPVTKLAAQVLETLDKSDSINVNALATQRGIGIAKACLLSAALEFSRRRIRPEGTRIKKAEDALPLLHHLRDRNQEHFVCLSLNGAHEVIALRIVTIGLVNAAHVHPREVFADPLKDRATAIIVAHNHPSGELEPSAEDRAVTKRLLEAGKVLGITVLDHIIFSHRGFTSFANRGEM